MKSIPLSLNSRILRAIIVIVGVGILLGGLWGIQEFRQPAVAPGIEDLGADVTIEQRASFADYFSMFFLGRPGVKTSIRKNTPLVRAGKFIASERVGLRVQTAPKVISPITLELRFLTRGAREETADLKKYRQRFTIRPGFFSYCCVRMPKTPGFYDVGLVLNESFIAFLPARVIPAPNQIGGTGLVPP